MQSFLSLFSVPELSGSRPQGQPTSSEVAQANGASARIEQAFASASRTTGLPFDFFMTTAMRESSLDVNAAAATSTARGPFQFIEQTWLGMMHEHGDTLGLSQEAAAIERRSDGRYRVESAETREAVLAMRHDPELSAVMSGLYLMENAADLENALGRPVTVGEGYVAHVFGPSGAGRLISLAEQQPNRIAADVFPTQAAANRGLFYDRSGAPVSVRQLYDRLVDGFPTAPVSTQLPAMQAARSSLSVPSPTPAPAAQKTTEPLALQPSGFADLPQADPVSPDALTQLGLFSPAGRGSVPFFAALYRPDGLEAPQLTEEVVATHGQMPPTSVNPGGVMPNPVAHPDDVGQPLDLVTFVQSGQLVGSYRNPAEWRAGVELVPPV